MAAAGMPMIVSPHLQGGVVMVISDHAYGGNLTMLVGDRPWTMQEEIAEDVRRISWEVMPETLAWLGEKPFQPAARTARQVLDSLKEQTGEGRAVTRG